MTLTVHGYLEQPYLKTPYLASTAELGTSSQVNLVIQAAPAVHQQVQRVVTQPKTVSSQVNRTIAGATKAVSSQVQLQIAGSKAVSSQVQRQIAAAAKATRSQVQRQIGGSAATSGQVLATIAGAKTLNSQVSRTIAATSPLGSQVLALIAHPGALSSQVLRQILQASLATSSQVQRIIAAAPALHSQVLRLLAAPGGGLGMSVMPNTFLHEICGEYLIKPYLATPYLSLDICAQGRFQVNLITTQTRPTGSQVLRQINNFPRATSSQVQRQINAQAALRSQVLRLIASRLAPVHSQVKRQITLSQAASVQVNRAILAASSLGSQITRVFVGSLHQQVTLVLYNTTGLRVLSKFPSRGNGSNWTASSTAAGDFNVNNLNNDIVEFVWRSNGATTGVTLTADTGVPQGVFVDTIGILGHNFTLSAVVVLQESNDPTFATVGHEITLATTLNNMYFVSPMLPIAGYRYQRFVINDPTNPAGYLQVGTIVYGAAMILIGEDIVDQIKWKKTHYKDSIPTEGFTNVSNDRALRRKLGLQFKDLDFQKANYANLEALFDYARTSLKCLWIPTPQYPTRFAIFGKLTDLPDETHNDKGVDINYIDLSLEVDESL